MLNAVKLHRKGSEVKRSYTSPVREAQAARTRARIREAATRLFVERGYVATSMREVARVAGVGERTVYAAFPTKYALYADALGVAIAGDEQPVAVVDRPETRATLADPDPHRALAAAVDLGVALLDRAGDLIVAGLEAAGADADLRTMDDEGAAATHAAQLALARHLDGLGALRIDVAEAADVLYTLGSPHVHHLMRRDRGWSTQRYRDWLLATLTNALLR